VLLVASLLFSAENGRANLHRSIVWMVNARFCQRLGGEDLEGGVQLILTLLGRSIG
jgi:hypothetical protein